MIIDVPPTQTVAEPPLPSTPEENKVIDLRGEPLEIQAKEQEAKFCLSHCKSIYVDADSRLLECRECGKVLDPFDYILGWANEGKRRMQRLKSLDDEIRMKCNDLHEIKAALSREKARVRRVNPDAPEVITWQRQMAKRRGEA